MIILFDLDGTLIDSTEAILESFENSFALHGYEKAEKEKIKALIGHPLDIMYQELGVKKKDIEAIVETYKRHYRKISTQKTVLLQNAAQAVKDASTFATLGIVTTKTGEYSKVLMEHFELMHHFEVLIGREHVVHPKPHAEPILKAIEQLKYENKEIWMIGDTSLDLLAAKNAGVNSIAVLSGYEEKETLKKHTNIIFCDALEAVAYLMERKISHT